MTATTLDMRYRTHDLFESLECPVHVVDHPFFGSASDETTSVNETIDSLREGRYDDL